MVSFFESTDNVFLTQAHACAKMESEFDLDLPGRLPACAGKEDVMTRYEFTERLRSALMGEVPDAVIEEHIRFYERYISDEMAAGKSEDEVLAGLGDARLIAKTILDTWQSQDTDLEQEDNIRTTQIYEPYETYEEDGNRSYGQGADSIFSMNGKVYRLDKWYLKLIPILIVLMILAFVFFMLFGMMRLAILILTSPVFWGFVLLMVAFNWLSRRR